MSYATKYNKDNYHKNHKVVKGKTSIKTNSKMTHVEKKIAENRINNLRLQSANKKLLRGEGWTYKKFKFE